MEDGGWNTTIIGGGAGTRSTNNFQLIFDVTTGGLFTAFIPIPLNRVWEVEFGRITYNGVAPVEFTMSYARQVGFPFTSIADGDFFKAQAIGAATPFTFGENTVNAIKAYYGSRVVAAPNDLRLFIQIKSLTALLAGTRFTVSLIVKETPDFDRVLRGIILPS